jgi:hypothetical protein
MIIYRAISNKERLDYLKHRIFRTTSHTLEAKQFFISESGAQELIIRSRISKFSPPYDFVLEIDIDESCLSKIFFYDQPLDGHEALTIPDIHLTDFNKCVNLVIEHEIV